MERPSETKAYLSAVLEQIRYKKVHDELSREIEAHILDQKEAYMAQGMDPEEAEKKAVAQMGDPVLVGTELDRIYRPRPEWSIIALTAALLLFGLIIRHFADVQAARDLASSDLKVSSLALGQFLGSLAAGSWRVLFIALGLGLMALIYFIDFTILGRYSRSIFFSLSLLAVLAAGYLPLTFGHDQHLLYILMLFPTAFAGVVFRMRGKGYWGVLLCGVCLAIPSTIAFIMSLNSVTFLLPFKASFLILWVTGPVLLTVAIWKNWFGSNRLFSMLLIYVLLHLGLAGAMIRVWDGLKIAAADSPMDDFARIIKQLLSGARFIGQGTFNDIYPAGMMLPAIESDFLLTYAIHRFGWIIFLVAASLLVAFIAAAFSKCLRLKSVLAQLVSLSVVLNFTMQTILYILFNLGLASASPLPLPLISRGNGFILVNLCLIGVLLSTFRTGRFVSDPPRAKRHVKPWVTG